MPHWKLLFKVGLFLISTLAWAQDPATPSPTPQPSPVITPFIADPTQAEKPADASTPTPTPDTSFPITPLATPAPAPQAAASDGPSAPRALPVSEREVITRLQIFLDQRNFGPGKIDGRWGEFCAKALQRYQVANGLPPTGQIDEALQKQIERIFPIYTTYLLTDSDFKRVGPTPYKPKEQAKTKAMLYRSISEFIAERFHSGEDFITKLNSDQKMETLKVGDTVRVPNVPPFQLETIAEIGNLPIRPEFAKRLIRIDTRYRMLDIMEGEKIVGSFPITPGSAKLPAPIGTWRIVGIATLPWFRWDEAMLNHGQRSENFYNIPPGPRNPVGILWIGLNKRGIGIHGTATPDTIGRSGSHGCIRLANWDAARVMNQVTEGMTVQIF
jgi:lipoprotein-anchoring transpeptidase ErfK/SrfK